MDADSPLLKCQFLLLFGILILQTTGWSGGASACFTLTFFGTVFLWIRSIEPRIRGGSVLAMLLVCLSLIHILLNAMASGTELSFSYFKKGILFGTTVLFFDAMAHCCPDKKTVVFLFRLNTLLALFFVGMYFGRNEAMHLLNGNVSQYLTFRFTNPNLAGAFLAEICILEMVQVFAFPGKHAWGHVFLAAGMAWFVGKTQSRNSQLFLAVFFLMAFFLALWPKPRRVASGWAGFFAGFPFLFAASYGFLLQNRWIRSLFGFWTGPGKPLDSRMKIWERAWEAVGASPLVGAYSQISGGTGMSQMHNSHIDVLASYGMPVFFLFLLFLTSLIWIPDRRGNVSILCMAGFCSLLLSGLGEAMLFSGGMGIYLLAGAMRMLANVSFADGEERR